MIFYSGATHYVRVNSIMTFNGIIGQYSTEDEANWYNWMPEGTSVTIIDCTTISSAIGLKAVKHNADVGVWAQNPDYPFPFAPFIVTENPNNGPATQLITYALYFPPVGNYRMNLKGGDTPGDLNYDNKYKIIIPDIPGADGNSSYDGSSLNFLLPDGYPETQDPSLVEEPPDLGGIIVTSGPSGVGAGITGGPNDTGITIGTGGFGVETGGAGAGTPDVPMIPTIIGYNSNVLLVQFTNSSIGDNLNVYWDFGDGFTSMEHSPTHTYSSVGIYQVSLTVANSYGSNTSYRVVQISSGAPPSIGAETTGGNGIETGGNGIETGGNGIETGGTSTTFPPNTSVPQMVIILQNDYPYFEDLDRNGDGVINYLDGVAIQNQNNDGRLLELIGAAGAGAAAIFNQWPHTTTTESTATSFPPNTSVPQMVVMLQNDYPYFEDLDRNGDGVINYLDGVAIQNQNNDGRLLELIVAAGAGAEAIFNQWPHSPTGGY